MKSPLFENDNEFTKPSCPRKIQISMKEARYLGPDYMSRALRSLRAPPTVSRGVETSVELSSENEFNSTGNFNSTQKIN